MNLRMLVDILFCLFELNHRLVDWTLRKSIGLGLVSSGLDSKSDAHG